MSPRSARRSSACAPSSSSSDAVGGRCLNVACIPAKAVLRAADVLSEVREAGDFGIVVAEPSVDFAAVMARRDRVVSTLTGGVSGLFKKNTSSS